VTKETRLEATNTFPAKGEERTEAQLELAATLSCIARGDNAAFERLYRTTSAKLYSVISHIVRNDAAAEEVLQDVYFTIWSKSQLYDSVRRQNIWRNSRRRLAEYGPRLVVDVMRRACGVASADIRWSFA
jgi:hypothetical protein